MKFKLPIILLILTVNIIWSHEGSLLQRMLSHDKITTLFVSMENSMDSGAWWATVHDVTKSHTFCNIMWGSRIIWQFLCLFVLSFNQWPYVSHFGANGKGHVIKCMLIKYCYCTRSGHSHANLQTCQSFYRHM